MGSRPCRDVRSHTSSYERVSNVRLPCRRGNRRLKVFRLYSFDELAELADELLGVLAFAFRIGLVLTLGRDHDPLGVEQGVVDVDRGSQPSGQGDAVGRTGG